MENSIPVLLLSLSVIICGEIQFQIMEESPLETVIGNLFKSGYTSSNEANQLIILNLKDRAVNCFKINDRGDLLVARSVDRDIICQQQSPDPFLTSKSDLSLTDECKVTLQVASKSNNMIVPVVIIIEDRNDNSPRWSQDRIDIKIIDGCKERTKVPLPTAHDQDIGANAQIEYTIKERELPFRINNVDGLYLETLQSLDRESKEVYKFTIVATDKGHPARFTEIEALLTVEDINDNNPMFTKTIYRFKSISESSPVGYVVGKLEATDADSGVNGKFHFKFANSASVLSRRYFTVYADGTVTVNSPLDCDRGESQYKFKVIVEDEAVRPYSRSSEATVLVAIDDVNDEVPELKLVFMNRDLRTNNPFIVEHSKIGTLIGILEVRDVDFKGSDVVTCSDSPLFSLLHEDRQTKYRIVTNVEFDREKRSEVVLAIVCQDGAGNKASTNQSIVIRDINDNLPTFTRQLYVSRIKENMQINSRLSEKVQAVDADGESVVQYYLAKEYEGNFTIDRNTGIISTKVVFDREECGLYTIKVLATDATHGTINTGTGTVKVVIDDENDNPPIFSQDVYSFHISENNLPPTNVGTVEASDQDSTDQQGTLKYYLDNSPSSKHFQIDHRSGQIRAITSLDREKMTHYILPVFVEDGQNRMLQLSRRHTATSTVTVIVDDVNDNSPKFVLPNATRNSFEISIKETVGHKITYILADDADSMDNARITYRITHGNDLALFSIDPTSGLLFLSDSLQSHSVNLRQFFALTVEACDSGRLRPICTEFKNLRIIIKSGKDSSLMNTDLMVDTNVQRRPINVHQEAIMICLAIVFIVLLISCAALIVLMKFKPALWCRRPHRTNSKDKSFDSCVNSQMLPTIDGNVHHKDMDDNIRNFCSENLTWRPNEEHLKSKMGKYVLAMDHTNPPEYQTLESLCLASSLRCHQQPRFVDPCSMTHTLMPVSQSTSFLSNHGLALRNDVMLTEGVPNHIYQAVEEDNVAQQQFYSKLRDPKKGSTHFNLNNNSMDHGNKNGDFNKYGSYSYNEASFV